MMRRRSSLLIPFAFAGLLVPRPAAGQSSSPYVPPTHWAVPQLEALIAGRVIPDPSPLLRPFRRMDAVRALRQADTARATRATRETVRRLVAELDDPATDRVRYRADLFFAVRSATHARRNELRDSGPGGTWPALGGWGDATVGPVVLATSIEGDYRLDDDPDYRGGKVGPTTRKVPTRIPVAYLSAQFRFGELLYGALPANWGPAFVEGFALSPEPFSYDALTVRLGTRDRHLGLLATQLDHTVDSTGARVNRYLAAHYLYLRFGPAVALNLWETTLFAGVDRSFEPWFLNPLKLTNYAATDEERVESNNLVGLDLAVSPAGWPRLHLSLYADDLSALVGEDEPFQGGVTVGAQGGLARGAVSWTAFYTLVSNLSYRAGSPAETYQRRGVGLARNQSDYDQLTLRATWSPLPLTVVGPELTLVRQGEGDLRDPFPADLTTAPTLHQGVVERTLRLAIRGDVSVRAGPVGGTLAASAALHHVSNAGHVDGVSDDRFVGFITGMVRLPLAGTW